MKFNTKEEQLDALCSAFPKNVIKSRIQRGVPMYYLPVDALRTRLWEVFGADYDFATNHVRISDHNWDMSCILSLRWVDGSSSSIEEWGSSDILMKEGKGRTGDPAKTAASDAFKRCLAFVGCGGELYNEEYRKSLEESESEEPPPPVPAIPFRQTPARKLSPTMERFRR